ncbi:MAG: leucine-rich repeat domain-containing protein [Beutenbergiaceae bacterium]
MGLAVAPAAAFADPGDEVVIGDDALRSCVESTLGVSAGDLITEADMATLTMLVCWGSDTAISDIDGLQYATNLTDIQLNGDGIVDVGPLSGLTNLTHLSLGSIEIVDVGPLSGLTNLTSLYLSGNEIVDVGPLSGLTNLTSLNLSGNKIVDVGPLSGLTNLTDLNLSGNEIVDAGPLSGLTNLTYLDLVDNGMVDVASVGVAVAVPSVVDVDGSLIPLVVDTRDGELSDGMVTWNTAGESTLSWSSPSTSFSGTLRYTVTAPGGESEPGTGLIGVGGVVILLVLLGLGGVLVLLRRKAHKR